MNVYKNLINKKSKLALVGLGYVGMPIAVAFSKKINVIGFDTNPQKISLYKQGFDPTQEVGDKIIKNAKIFFTDNSEYLKEASFIIVAVPTPINQDKTPDLTPVEKASQIVGKNLSKGDTITLYVPNIKNKYPDFTTYSASEIFDFCNEHKLTCRFQQADGDPIEYDSESIYELDNYKVLKQSREKGTRITEGTTLTIKLDYLVKTKIDDTTDSELDD